MIHGRDETFPKGKKVIARLRIWKERDSEVERMRAGKIGENRIAGERKSEWLGCCWDGKVCSVAGRKRDGGWNLVGMGRGILNRPGAR